MKISINNNKLETTVYEYGEYYVCNLIMKSDFHIKRIFNGRMFLINSESNEIYILLSGDSILVLSKNPLITDRLQVIPETIIWGNYSDHALIRDTIYEVLTSNNFGDSYYDEFLDVTFKQIKED